MSEVCAIIRHQASKVSINTMPEISMQAPLHIKSQASYFQAVKGSNGERLLEVAALKNDGGHQQNECRIGHPVADNQRHVHHSDIKLMDHMSF